MAVRIRFRKFVECDTEAELDVSLGDEEALFYSIDTAKYWKIDSGSFIEVPLDEIFLISPIAISKLDISGVPDGTKFLRDDGAWADAGGGSGSGDQVVITILANTNISAYAPVTADGYIADSSSVNDRNRIVGVAKNAISSGFTGDIVSDGKIVNASWSWTPGDKIFLNGTSLSTTAPGTGFVQIIGIAYAADTIDVQIKQGTLL